LVDGRSRAQFEGAEKSPQAARPGRIPGAVHIDHAQAFEPGTGRLRPTAELEGLFAPLPHGPAVSYCNTGHLASTNWFVLSEVLKRPGVTLYDGSMSEWTGDPAHPVDTGPEATR
jgi:thiosulfate/3-mercaptopyruvate sulfurtransferase